ncbi:SecDF P1 head subdomain-containing protein [Alysiella crassa]|uniref:Preprotein translocase subunit SecD n=1 Tax=Alysiella crassa TaxID=153491 RepID=A0A376BUY9_9NEIS|nr:hypothetical protein [Alysiella crassa]UOP06278.1 hypothetical protein LVJ80_10750 [Alysiella crassa]SSY80770.1 preprotein translocase subunit SecD [Alysiella crassa]
MLNLLKKSLFLFFFGATTLVHAQTAQVNENVRIGIVATNPDIVPKKQRVHYQSYTFTNHQTHEQNIPHIIKKKPLMNQLHIKKIYAGFDSDINIPTINIHLNPNGRALFHRITQQHKGKMLALVDTLGQNIISAPRINEPIAGGKIQMTGVMYSELNDLVSRLQKKVTIHEVVEKPFGAKLAHDEMVMYQKSAPTPPSVNLFIHDNFILKNNDFSKIEWQQETAKTVFGSAAKDMEEMPVHIIILHLTPSAKQQLEKWRAQKNNRSLGEWLLWKQDNPSINHLKHIEIHEDYFYFYTLSDDTAQEIWQSLTK